MVKSACETVEIGQPSAGLTTGIPTLISALAPVPHLLRSDKDADQNDTVCLASISNQRLEEFTRPRCIEPPCSVVSVFRNLYHALTRKAIFLYLTLIVRVIVGVARSKLRSEQVDGSNDKPKIND